MRGLLADHNIQGQVRVLQRILQGPEWKEIWSSLQMPVLTFKEIGLARKAKDVEIWRRCQAEGWVLITANRNEDTTDSLEAVIKRENSEHCLPVFTLADASRIRKNKSYAKRVAEQMLTYLIEIDKYRGTGRLFLP
jgi:Domain of unknown function (DUF5615)